MKSDKIFKSKEEKEDDVPEVPEEPIAKLGDIYQLGKHRIMCGDSVSEQAVKLLMDGKKSNMIFTDPPYNVDYGISKNPRHKYRTIENDKQTDDEWLNFNNKLALLFKEYNEGDIYCWGAPSPEGMKQRLIFAQSGIHWSTTIVWKKDRLVLSPAKYQRMYEPCFYGWSNKGKSSYNGGRKQVEVWVTELADEELLLWAKDYLKNNGDIIEIDRPVSSKLHPTMKPIALCEKAITNSSRREGIVLDLFLGSGSTLIACEKINRACYGMELDPKYIDVIIKRWEDYSGSKAIKING